MKLVNLLGGLFALNLLNGCMVSTPKLSLTEESLDLAYPKQFIQSLKLPKHIDPKNFQDMYNFLNEKLNEYARLDYQWQCQSTQKTIQENIKHYQFNCNGKWPESIPKILYENKAITDININVIQIDVSQDSTVQVKPFITAKVNEKGEVCTRDYEHYSDCQKPILPYVKQYNQNHNQKLLVGINGGYFHIADQHFYDTNCLWVNKTNNQHDYTVLNKLSFLSDSLLIINQQNYAFNCATFGKKLYSPARATFIKNMQGDYDIKNIAAGQVQLTQVDQALGAGPILIQDAQYQLDWQALPPSFEFAANSSIALGYDLKTNDEIIVLITVDGDHHGKGMFAFQIANFFKMVIEKSLSINIESLMSLDRGGSSTMVVCNQHGSRCQQVSESGQGIPGRTVLTGLGVYLK